MNRLVYLFELDSVRNSDQEVKLGQQALYEEIVTNGNCVVLSFNQLSDSRAFLSLIYNENSYQHIIELFRLGAIKVSQFGKTQTASQYIQISIAKCLDNINRMIDSKIKQRFDHQLNGHELFENDTINIEAAEEDLDTVFIFSGLPIRFTDIDLLEKMQEALIYSNPSIIDDYKEFEKTNSQYTPERAKNLEFISRYIRLILAISIEKEGRNPSKKSNEKTFTDYMDLILNRYNSQFTSDKLDSELCTVLPDAMHLLKTTKTALQDNQLQLRSNWYTELPKKNTSEKAIAEMIVDLCYNYVIESSIYNVSKHYLNTESHIDTFFCDFETRLQHYWKLYKNNHHTLYNGETEHIKPLDSSSFNWEAATRIWANHKNKSNKSSDTHTYISLYEYNYQKEKHRWNVSNIQKTFITVAIAVFYILVFCIVDWATGMVEDFITDLWSNISFNWLASFLINIIISTIAFGVMGSFISNRLNLPDVLDSIISIWRSTFIDLPKVFTKTTTSTHSNTNYYNNIPIDSNIVTSTPDQTVDLFINTSITASTPKKTQEWIAYEKLIISHPEYFHSSELVDIVTDWDIVSRYEYVNNRKLGVVYQSEYNLFVVDLIDNKNGGYYTYERLIPAVSKGAVVVLTKYQNKFVLLKQYRHAPRDFQYAFPRGFGEADVSPEDNVKKEISEELNATATSITYLGETIADSGICGNKVSVYQCEIDSFETLHGYEGIDRVVLLTEDEFKQWVKKGKINDGFSLTAYSLYLLKSN